MIMPTRPPTGTITPTLPVDSTEPVFFEEPATHLSDKALDIRKEVPDVEMMQDTKQRPSSFDTRSLNERDEPAILPSVYHRSPRRQTTASMDGNRTHSPPLHSAPYDTAYGSNREPWIGSSKGRKLETDDTSIRSSSSSNSSNSNHSVQSSCSVVMPLTPPSVPFLPNRAPADASGCSITIDASSPSQYVVTCTLPGYSYEHVTVALKRHGSLHILADRFDDPPSRASTPSVSRMDSQRTVTSASMKPKLTHMASTSGLHFERLVELPNCVNGRTFADWDAATQTLKVSVGRRALEGWQIKELQQASSQQKQPNTLAASTLSDRDRERRSSLPGNV